MAMPTTRLGPHDSASAAAPVVKSDSSRGKKSLCMREDYDEKLDAPQQLLQ